MRALAEAAMFTGLALALHLGGLATVASLGAGGSPAAGSGGREMITLEGGGPAAQALVARWTKPPDAGPPAAPPAAPGASAAPQVMAVPAAPGAVIGGDGERPAALPRHTAADAAPSNLPRRQPARPDLVAGTAALARPAPLGDASGSPVMLAARGPEGPPPSTAARLAAPPNARDRSPKAGAPAVAPAPRGFASPRPEERPASRPRSDENPSARAADPPPSRPVSRPHQRAAGAGGDAFAGAADAPAHPAAAEGRRARLMAIWGGLIRADVERRKHYPRAAAGARGTAVLRIALAADGRVRTAALSRSAGHPALDEAALGAVRAARFPPAPQGLGPGPHEFTFQMTFAQ